MLNYEEACTVLAKEYAHRLHDDMFARIKDTRLIGIIYRKRTEEVHNNIKRIFERNKKEWWR